MKANRVKIYGDRRGFLRTEEEEEEKGGFIIFVSGEELRVNDFYEEA